MGGVTLRLRHKKSRDPVRLEVGGGVLGIFQSAPSPFTFYLPIPNFQDSLSSQPTSPLFETATQPECGSEETKKVLILTQKSCLHEVL